MKAVFNVYANPKNDIYSNYLFTLHEVLEAIKLVKSFILTLCTKWIIVGLTVCMTYIL